MIEVLPIELRKKMEIHGLEEDSMSHKGSNLYIEIDDIEIAFDMREIMLEYGSCRLITHPHSRLPTLEIDDVYHPAHT